MSELHGSLDYNNLKFEYVGPTKDVSFYEYMDSKELAGKTLTEYTSLFSPNNFKKNDHIILNYLMSNV